ncbi:hypothetical protein [Pedobacter xixiisoli]|uniref:Uncharacterized protein n=1 Tax=Pedobacter xixiisoli TaxID=1476464 RepID=A0A286AF88_9SPHI|nr:hypothetical protein [Pedobacter xixiisoli]SOD20555.1 hypothetical protein SAMN06297358_4280 [Pedobacter xixiisoli]
MDLSKFLVNSASLAAGGTVIIVLTYYMVRNDIMNFLSSRKSVSIPEDKGSLLALRLQAHERMIIFVDRINPSNLLLRLHQQGIEVEVLQLMAVNEIKTEFQHNITQQLYLEAATWKVIRQLKDDTIAMINNAVKNLTADASGIELSKKVLHHMGEIEENPYELTIGLIKQDIHKLF